MLTKYYEWSLRTNPRTGLNDGQHDHPTFADKKKKWSTERLINLPQITTPPPPGKWQSWNLSSAGIWWQNLTHNHATTWAQLHVAERDLKDLLAIWISLRKARRSWGQLEGLVLINRGCRYHTNPVLSYREQEDWAQELMCSNLS